MGNRATACFRFQNECDGSIVPEKDPLVRPLTQRIVHDEISKDFDLMPKVLGTGYSGAVKLAIHRESKRQVAVKQFCKRQLKDHRIKLLQSEVEVYLLLDHPNVCRLLHAYEGKHTVWLVMELCSNELYSRLCERKVYTETDAAEVMIQMLQAINYLHSHRIVHRDLKLENWMYSAAEKDDRLKLIDFGFSRVLGDPDELLDMPCGTLHYTSPEVLARKYTSKCDIWSLGVIGYMLLVGRPPFRGPTNVKTARAIFHGEIPREGRWNTLSADAQSFLDKLLTKDASQRWTAGQALGHPWITGSMASSGCSGNTRGEIGLDVLKSLRQFAQGSHLRRVALTILAHSMTSQELQDLEQTFLDFDRSGQGTISLNQLVEVLREHCQAADRPEMSSQEVRRIFECLDVAGDDEVQYTPFVAAMLATRVKQHEDKIRAAFEAFDRSGTGYITADSLVHIFQGDSLNAKSGSEAASSDTGGQVGSSKGARSSVASSRASGDVGVGTLTREEAERWIREVDYKGNGVIDYEDFLDALKGKRLWAPWGDDDEPSPTVRVYEDALNGRPRGLSDSYACSDKSLRAESASSWITFGLAGAIIDPDSAEMERLRSQSFPGERRDKDRLVQVRNISIDVDEQYCSGKRRGDHG